MIPDRARPWLEAALAAHRRPLYTLADVEGLVERDEARLWLGKRSCILTQVHDYGTGERVLHVWLAGGDMDEIKTAIAPIEEWAVAAGCTQVSIDGRKGWERALAPFGFEHETTSLRKCLT